MTPTEIKIPDDAWMDWPDEQGLWYIGLPGEQSFVVYVVYIEKSQFTKRRFLSVLLTNWQFQPNENMFGATSYVYADEGYRFARVILPVVPSTENQ